MENSINPATVAIIKLILFFETSVKTLTNLTIFLKRAFQSDCKDPNQEKLEEISWTIDYSFVDFYSEVLPLASPKMKRRKRRDKGDGGTRTLCNCITSPIFVFTVTCKLLLDGLYLLIHVTD